MSRTLLVELGDRSYPIHIEQAGPHIAAEHIAEAFGPGTATLITDSNVAPLYLDSVVKALASHALNTTTHVITAGEASKTFAQAGQLLEAIVTAAPDRTRPVISLGGGVVGDIAGFLASVYRRGVPIAHIATSLLAQVYSAIGGKTAVNLAGAKNQVGSFYQPHLVVCPLDALSTLPERELRCGMAELLKYGFIRSPSLLQETLARHDQLSERNTEAFEGLIVQCCQHKADIVAQDERESGMRALLNFGHTFGHALELSTSDENVLNHGEAVSIGMVAASRISALRGLCDPAVPRRVEAILQRCHLPTDAQRFRDAPWRQALAKDKKSVGSEQIQLILLRAIGAAEAVIVPRKEAIFWIEQTMFG